MQGPALFLTSIRRQRLRGVSNQIGHDGANVVSDIDIFENLRITPYALDREIRDTWLNHHATLVKQPILAFEGPSDGVSFLESMKFDRRR
jgi:hypothetical protein